MSSPFRTKKFQNLKERWYAKLAKSDFKDIEQDELNLKEWESHSFSARYNRHLFASKEAYYQLVGQFLYSHPFNTEHQKFIWECHSEGKSTRAISKELKTKKWRPNSKDSVSRTIRQLAKVMLAQNNENN